MSQVFILKTTDVEFTTRNGFKDHLVIFGKEVEAFVRATVFNNCLGKFVQLADTHTHVINSGDKL